MIFGREANTKFGEGYNVSKVLAALDTTPEDWIACKPCGEPVHDGPCSIDSASLRPLFAVMNGGVRCNGCKELYPQLDEALFAEYVCGNCSEGKS